MGIAKDNTLNNTETCGIIAGKDNSTDFVVTHLVIPKQWGTSDSCTAMDENTVSATLEETDCITVGLIHTHPSQTAFLSSINLHTHAGYQALLPEAIAVVCSVKYSNTKIFKLTIFGMNTIHSCKQTGFHHHDQISSQPLFEECNNVELCDSQLIIKDLSAGVFDHDIKTLEGIGSSRGEALTALYSIRML